MKAKRSRGSGSLYRPKDSNNWWIQIYVDGKRHREPTGTDNKRKAENILRDKIAEVTTGNFNPLSHKVTVAELVKAKITANKNNGNKSTDDDESRWRLHLQPVFGTMLASRVTTPMLSKYVTDRLEDAEAGTVNRELSLLRAAFYLAYESTPPLVQRVPHFPMLQERNVRKGFLTDKQYDDLGANCLGQGVWMRAMMEVGATYGWRREEVIALKVNQIDIPGKSIRLHPNETKNDDGREVAISNPVLLTLLASCIEGKTADDSVFTWPTNHRFKGRPVKDFRDRWEKVTVAAGVPNLLFHDLRRTAARNLRRAGVPETIIMKIGGWRTPDVFRRYAIVDTNDMADAMAKLEKSKIEFSQRTAKEAPEVVQEQGEVRPN